MTGSRRSVDICEGVSYLNIKTPLASALLSESPPERAIACAKLMVLAVNGISALPEAAPKTVYVRGRRFTKRTSPAASFMFSDACSVREEKDSETD